MTASPPPEPSDMPFVSVVIPVLNEERYVAACLTSVVQQTYPHDRMEVIVADGGSTDRTRGIVADFASTHPFIRIIDNPARIQAAGLNAAIHASRGDVIARIDGHAQWPPSHLERCVSLLASTGADNVGGTMEAVGDTATGEAIARATRNPFAIGGARYRYAKRQQEADTVWLGCFRRRALEAAGLYDESLEVHEDYELNHRLRIRGGRVIYSPDLPVRYWTRGSWSSLAKQYFRYGRGKARVARREPGVLRPYHLVPPLAVLAAVATLPLAAVSHRARKSATAVSGLYAAGCLAAGMVAGRGAPLAVTVRVPLVFPVLHVSWGAGFLSGYLRSGRRRPV